MHPDQDVINSVPFDISIKEKLVKLVQFLHASLNLTPLGISIAGKLTRLVQPLHAP